MDSSKQVSPDLLQHPVLGWVSKKDSPHIPLSARLLIKGLNAPAETAAKKLGEDFPDLDTTDIDGQIYIRKKGESYWDPLDSPNFTGTDVLEMAPDAVEMGLSGLATTAGASVGGPAGALWAGGTSAALLNSLKQSLAVASGYQNKVNPMETAFVGSLGGLMPAALTKPLGGGASYAGKGVAKLGEVVSKKVPASVWETYYKNLDKMKPYVTGTADQANQYFNKYSSELANALAEGQKLAGKMYSTGKERVLDTLGSLKLNTLKPMEQLAGELAEGTVAGNSGRTALNEADQKFLKDFMQDIGTPKEVPTSSLGMGGEFFSGEGAGVNVPRPKLVDAKTAATFWNKVEPNLKAHIQNIYDRAGINIKRYIPDTVDGLIPTDDALHIPTSNIITPEQDASGIMTAIDTFDPSFRDQASKDRVKNVASSAIGELKNIVGEAAPEAAPEMHEGARQLSIYEKVNRNLFGKNRRGAEGVELMSDPDLVGKNLRGVFGKTDDLAGILKIQDLQEAADLAGIGEATNQAASGYALRNVQPRFGGLQKALTAAGTIGGGALGLKLGGVQGAIAGSALGGGLGSFSSPTAVRNIYLPAMKSFENIYNKPAVMTATSQWPTLFKRMQSKEREE